MKLALITPIDMLDLAGLSDYHLMLPQLYDDERYRRFYTDVEGFKILDNGAAEGYVADPRELHDLGLALGANEIVVPDALEETDATIDLARRFGPYACPDEFSYVGVAQGRTVAEIIKCITFFEHTEWITTLALPRILNNIHKTTRFNLVVPIMKEYKFNAVHCLGASSWVREVIALADDTEVRGMDTSLPIVMGLAGRSLRDAYVGRSPGYFDEEVDRNTTKWKVIEDNVRTYFDWARQDFGGLDKDTQAPPSGV
jgi:hypothetical protein